MRDSHEKWVAIGRAAGHRGRSGELTVRVYVGEASPWIDVREVRLSRGEGDDGEPYDVESARGYRDRLVLKLRGVDDGNGAEALRGCTVRARRDAVPRDVDPRQHPAILVGFEVLDEDGARVGVVRDVQPTRGQALLVVEDPHGEELLVPLAEEIVHAVDRAGRVVRIRPPAGLLDLNRDEGRRG